MPHPLVTVELQNRVLQITVDVDRHGLSASWPLPSQSDPVDHMLALIHDPGPVPKRQALANPDIGAEEWKRAAELRHVYLPLIDDLLLPPEDGVRRVAKRIRALRRDDVPAEFLAIAKRGQRGLIDKRLAPYLERVRFLSPTKVEVETFTDLAAWSLHHAIMRGGYTVRRCELCKHPFLASERARYCRREAPGGKRSCQDIAKVKNYRARKGENN